MKFVLATTLLVAFLGTCLSQETPEQTSQSSRSSQSSSSQSQSPEVPGEPGEPQEPGEPGEPQEPQGPTINPLFEVPPPTPPPSTAQANFDLFRNRQRWIQNRPRSYQYRLRRNCACSPNFVGPFLVRVSPSSDTDLIVFEGDQPATGPPFPPRTDVPSIEQLFNIIDGALNGANPAFRVDVDYDPVYGVPRRITIDRSENAADDEITYVVDLVRGFSRPRPPQLNNPPPQLNNPPPQFPFPFQTFNPFFRPPPFVGGPFGGSPFGGSPFGGFPFGLG